MKVVFTLSGWAQVGSALGTAQLAPGTILTIGTGLECWGVPTGSVRTGTFYIDPKFLADHLPWLPPTHPLVHLLHRTLDRDQGFGLLQLPEQTMQQLTTHVARIEQLQDQPGADFLVLSATADVLHVVGRAAGAASCAVNDSVLGPAAPRIEVARAASLLRSELSRQWRIEDLANEVSLSASQLGRLFRVELGLSPAAYLMRLRAERMAELLAAAGLSVSEAACEVGWQNPAVASRAFKRRHGVSPRDFSAFNRKLIEERRSLLTNASRAHAGDEEVVSR